MKKKLFMKRQEEGLNVPGRGKRRLDRHCSSLRRRPKVGSLTYVASCFIPRIWMSVPSNLGEEHNAQHC